CGKNEIFEQLDHAGQFNFGTMNFQALSGLDTAIDFIHEIGREKIRNRIQFLTDYLIEALSELPVKIISPVKHPDQRSAIVLIDLLQGNNAEAVEFLRKNNVITTIRAGKIRISCNFFNNTAEIDKLAEMLALFCEIEIR
ncbi:MAG: aminotransferase class V-fold PLP-dependent enzyme, partial [Bacteroidota bacterium]